MAAPTSQPEWATDASADIVAPTSGKQGAGWAAEERPPAGYLNWLFYWIYQWILHFFSHTITINASAFQVRDQAAPVGTRFQGYYWQSSSAQDIVLNCDIPGIDGKILDSLTIYVEEGDAGGEEINADLYEIDMASGTGGATAKGGSKSSGTTGGNATFGWTNADAGIPLTIDAAGGNSYMLEVTLQQTSANGESKLFGIECNYVNS